MNIDLVQSPARREWTCLAFPELLSAGDLAGTVACFARDACFVTPDATAIHGRDHIRPALAQLIACGTRIESELRQVVMAGEIAWARERWTLRVPGAGGAVVELASTPVLVMRRLEDRWKLAILAPWS
jgi:ketosteroid isomerase-like protein